MTGGTYRKRLLPNYSVFDEERWFVPGEGPPPLFGVGGAVVGVSICEDVWSPGGPVAELGRAGAQVVVNMNASPYSRGRRAERLSMLVERAAEAGCPLVYVNQVGGQDELVFDGASLVVGADGLLLAAGRQFEEDLVVVDVPLATPAAPARTVEVTDRPVRPSAGPVLAPTPPTPLGDVAEVYEALVLGTRDYLAKNGFTGAVVGLSGGIDSSLVAAVAADAVGPDRVTGLAMPSRYSSPGSVSDAVDLARRLGIALAPGPDRAGPRRLLRPPDPGARGRAGGARRREPPVARAGRGADGLLQRHRGHRAHHRQQVGDGHGLLDPLRRLGRGVRRDQGRAQDPRLRAVPPPQRQGRGRRPARPRPRVGPGEAALGRAPARPARRPVPPPYDLLDPVLAAYVEQDRTAADLVAEGFDPELVVRVVGLVDGAEYKRRQMPPGVRITTKAFGKDRRMPITNRYRVAAPVRHG